MHAKGCFPSTVGMQEPRLISPEHVLNPKTRKKKSSSKREAVLQTLGNVKGLETIYPPFKAPKILKGKSGNEASPSFQHPERSNSDSLPDTSSGSEYRTLRRKYLLLEEESFLLKNELNEAEAEVRTLEEEKFALLDQLLVLEGLIDPADLRPQE
ncbi:hypothetical protein H6P81_001102 [Aristolochia fimbriata]|uniref:Uncharacterized protein n=1 Tax=Aristolochia fimbriata TaxID=158543 RepID=A0AAV7F7K6_ARIFI|nr:hypothetical protein H6P81_001102 [Aristolochia fimbriata]